MKIYDHFPLRLSPVLARTSLSWLCCNRNRKTGRPSTEQIFILLKIKLWKKIIIYLTNDIDLVTFVISTGFHNFICLDIV